MPLMWLLNANGANQQRRKSKGKVQPLFDIPSHEEEEENPTQPLFVVVKTYFKRGNLWHEIEKIIQVGDHILVLILYIHTQTHTL